ASSVQTVHRKVGFRGSLIFAGAGMALGLPGVSASGAARFGSTAAASGARIESTAAASGACAAWAAHRSRPPVLAYDPRPGAPRIFAMQFKQEVRYVVSYASYQ